ncbi:MAG TPA: nuclear transport factor 2 family protein [Agriterribacter sp.]|nr:nuclear transport factor 2 family protein [Agriterribacter sp.]
MNRLIALLMVSAFLFNSSLFAQSKAEKEVADRVESLRLAMISGDKNALDELTAKELTYGHSTALIEDKSAFIQEFIDKKSVFTTIELTNQTVQIVGDVALVRHRLTGDTNNNNVAGKVDLTILLIWQKQKGSWKLLARQATKTPQ